MIECQGSTGVEIIWAIFWAVLALLTVLAMFGAFDDK